MHYLALIAVEIPEIEEDHEINTQIETGLLNLEQSIQEGGNGLLMQEMYWELMNNLRTTFSRTVQEAVVDQMAPYSAVTETPEYLEFWDQTEMVMEEYQGTNDCLKLPQGKIVTVHGYPNHGRFVIRDGKVFETNVGYLHHEKRTKRAKRIKALPDYPVKKRHPNLKEFAENTLCLVFNEDEQAYGYYYNPNAMWDGYSIGGRWPYMFLVKKTCTEYAIGKISWAHRREVPEAPKDYQWVCGARKKDIEWQAMHEWKRKELTERFCKLENFFQTGERPKGILGVRTSEGIRYGDAYQYYLGDKLEDYLRREGAFKDYEYPFVPHDIITRNGSWISEDDYPEQSDNSQAGTTTWVSQIADFYLNLSDNDVLVAIDYHI